MFKATIEIDYKKHENELDAVKELEGKLNVIKMEARDLFYEHFRAKCKTCKGLGYMHSHKGSPPCPACKGYGV